MLKDFKTVRTTLTLPADLAKRAQYFVDEGLIPNRNALIVAALERREIDRQFEVMTDDEAYQQMNEQLSETFAESDWEALVEGETA